MMKHLIILGDGMADWKIPSLGDRTILEAAHTPYMDLLASQGQTGILHTVEKGFPPGSEVANMSILGYDLRKVYQGRGVLEAAHMDIDLSEDDLALRCNLITTENGLIKNHSAGHITSKEASILIEDLDKQLGEDTIHFYPGVQYRHLLVIRNGNRQVQLTPPHDVPLKPFMPLLPKAVEEDIVPKEEGEASRMSRKDTADLITELILKSQELLRNHPVNLERQKKGQDMASSIWPWSPGYKPEMTPLRERFPEIQSGSVISAVDLIRGIGRYAGLRAIDVEGATGLFDTNYEGKAQAAIDALRSGDDFVFLHVEASDEAGHEGNVSLKIQTVEDLDRRIIGPVYEQVRDWEETVSIAVLPDHPTPCALRTHTPEPVPFLIWHRGITPDTTTTFSESSATKGCLGELKKDEFIDKFFSL